MRAIIVSAYGDMTNLRTAMNRGAFDFVTKPVDLNDLEITIRKTLDDIAKVREIDRLRAAAERARNNLSRYFSPNIVEMLAEQDEPLGAVRRQTVAVLFVDIVGFTRMAERMTPEAVVTMLRQFHERMTAQIFACGGTVEKYIGDAIFAVFGLPESGPGDAANALQMRRADDRGAGRLEHRAHAAGDPPLAIGIGLNYGPAVIGDVGSAQSLSFTVIGDTVNTASRLQGLTRTLCDAAGGWRCAGRRGRGPARGQGGRTARHPGGPGRADATRARRGGTGVDPPDAGRDRTARLTADRAALPTSIHRRARKRRFSLAMSAGNGRDPVRW